MTISKAASTRILIFIFLVVTCGLARAGQNPLPPGVYRGFNLAGPNEAEIEFTIAGDGLGTIVAADGKKILNGVFDLNVLVAAGFIENNDAETKLHLNKVFAAYKPQRSKKPLILVKRFLLPETPMDELEYSLHFANTPAVLIYPNGVVDDSAGPVMLFSPEQVRLGLFDKAVRERETARGETGSTPRIKTGGKSYKSCLQALSSKSVPN